MAHFRLVRSLILGVALATATGACGSSGEPDSTGSPGGLELRSDGIGTAEIGQPPDAVLAELNAFFGEPDVDAGWGPPASPLYGTCPGAQLRAIGWGSLYLFFVADSPVSDPASVVDGRLYSYSYGYDFARNEGATDPRSLRLLTERAIGLGSTRTDLRAAYGPQLREEYNAAADTWIWEVDDDAAASLRGLLSGPDDDATIVLIESAPGCEIG